jgi:sortase A
VHSLPPSPQSVPVSVGLRVVPAPGTLLGTLVIPRTGLQIRVREGVGPNVLALGVGHYRGFRYRFAGHDVTSVRGGAMGGRHGPFYWNNRLRRGDRIVFRSRGGSAVFRVVSSRVTAPTALSVLRWGGSNGMTLTTCWPRYSDARRLVVFARSDEKR